jgi:hypothetical protein
MLMRKKCSRSAACHDRPLLFRHGNGSDHCSQPVWCFQFFKHFFGLTGIPINIPLLLASFRKISDGQPYRRSSVELLSPLLPALCYKYDLAHNIF